MAEEGLGAEPPPAGRFLYVFGKKAILIDWIAFHTCSKPIERTKFLTFESESKKFNCSILLLLAIKVQNTFKILHYGLKF